MKSTLGFLLIFGWSRMLAGGAAFPNENRAGLDSRIIQVVWPAVFTNRWPENLWVYKVVPQEFSEVVVSNLMALGSFTMKDKVKSPNALMVDKEAICFQNQADALHWLEILPTLGYVEYSDEHAQARYTSSVKDVPEPVVGVPNQEETTRLGLKYLRLLGVDRSQLATKPGTDDLDLHWEKQTRGWLDQNTLKEINDTNVFGVLFLRRIDGINVMGIGRHGGVNISFANNAKVFRLQMCWRNLQSYALHGCPSPEQVTQWIQARQIKLRAAQGRLPNNIRKLTITQARFLYDGESDNKPMDFVFPFANFTATAESENSTNNTVWFLAPMTLAEENWQVINRK